MFTKLNPDLILEGVNMALQKDVMPYLNSEKAAVTVVMIQAMVESVRRTIPVYLQTLVAEHTDMQATLRDVGRIVDETPGDAAARLRERATSLGAGQAFDAVPLTEEIMAAHEELTRALVDTVSDLDALATEGHEVAEQALQRVRMHLGPRAAHDFATMVVGAGMAGRG